MPKSIDRKAVKKLVFGYKNDGRIDQDIYNELAPLYFDKKSLALLVAGTAKKEDIDKYKLLNILLVIIILVPAILKVLQFITLGFPKMGLFTPVIIPMPLIFAYIAYQVSNYSADAYIPCAAFAGFGFALSLQDMNNSKEILITFIFAVLIIGLSLFLVSKLFPKYKPRSIQKDEKGEYILKEK